MSDTVIKVENLSKEYRLGTINHGTLHRDLQSWWARVRGKEDPNSLVKAQHGLPGASSDRIVNNRFLALNDVSFEVKRGDTLGIIGRNGAGKSTLLKILSKVTAPTGGIVKIKGRIASLLEVGTGFHPELTGRENIFLNGAILGMSKAEIRKKFDEIVAFAEVEKFIDTPVKRYSSGMYVRLAFAVAAHLESEILVVDEVLAVGDAQFQKKCLGKMEEVGKEGRTVLFVSHNMQAIRQLCKRAVLIEKGSIALDGEPSTAIERYLMDQTINNHDDLDKVIRNLPPDPVFKLYEIKLTQEQRPIGRHIVNGKPLEIMIKYQVLEKVTGLRVFIDLYDSQDILLFRSFYDEDGDGIPQVEPGNYKSSAVIPANLLAPTKYVLKIFSTIYNVRYIYPNGITIPLSVERTGTTNRAYVAEPIRGRLAPSLCWKNQKC